MSRSLSGAPGSFTGALIVALCASCSAPAPVAERPRQVRTQQVEPIAGEDTLVQTGEVQPRRETDLGFPIDGRLARRLVEVGALVSKGQVLATLDDGLVQNELRAAEADLSNAGSAVELAQTSLSRQEKLFDAATISAQQLDEARANERAARARKDVAAAATLNARQKLAYAALRAPENGIVTAVGANAGQVLAPGQMVVRLATRERDAVFTVAERVVTSAPPDVKVHVRLVSSPELAVLGEVREVSPAADPVTRTYRVRVTLPSAPEAMVFGAAVTGSVEYPHGKSVRLPASAITSQDDKPAVYVVDVPSMKLQRRPVEVTRFGAEHVFIAAGLKSGDRVVTAGVNKLRPGQIVAVGEAGKDAP
jgi:RND family efflux transporter MFP subunit